ncbi:asparagine synthase (glutamine-hydrolyzing) [Azoarcus sp. DN11]|uniref:asparagine synthase (glutamine-hydrolyzing) n=1 Tax=Azoarcus sp. DN11 TaxID=356837 RepID=UPI000EACCE18|nr:asparagine synthase (glutamine-hydrolyzing) [Azoarcus sp. DN11]AYH42281.1 asparagine synthase (glutamine-hydrolyzing) [Azoarcus sp. DN11]
MCGIAGVVFQDRPADEALLRRMAAALAHRGPDDQGFFCGDGIGLAHTRLSIMDLAHGHQPLYARGDDLVVVANGEIYNDLELRSELEKDGAHYQTRSDSETILHAYDRDGDDCLQQLCGMFALALYDRPRKRLLLARDRLGIKPLFLGEVPGGYAFASELKALLPALPGAPAIDPDGLVQFLHNQFNSGRTTILKGVERIAPGEAVLFEAGRLVRRWQYWSALDVRAQRLTFEEAREQFDPLMETVMHQHMRADVPFGLFLSGGVDSGTLLALLTQYGKHPVRTFSVGFPGTGTQDELPPAREMATRYGSVHTEIRPDKIELFEHLPATVWAADDLMRDYASIPTSLLSQHAAQELKVVFSGEGGDEVFAGYGRFSSPSAERWIKSVLFPGSGGFRTSGSLGRREQRHLLGTELGAAFRRVRQPFIDAWRATPAGWTPLQRMQYDELVTALPDNLMVKSDRMMMAWGLEGRVPFLDHRIVEFGLSLPDDLKVSGRRGKVFLKEWARPYLQEAQVSGRKRGFHVPVGEWLSGDFLTRLEQLLPTLPAIRHWFNAGEVGHLVHAKRGGSSAATRTLFSLLQFALWHRIFIEGRGERPASRVDSLEFLAS